MKMKMLFTKLATRTFTARVATVLIHLLSCCAQGGGIAIAAPVNNKDATVLVAGGGPASLFFAHSLLSKTSAETKIHIYEKSSEPPTCYNDRNTKSNNNNGDEDDQVSFAFGFGLGNRAFAQLETWSPDLAARIRSIGAKTPGRLLMVNRRDMCAEMTASLLQTFPDRVTITYGATVQCVNDDCTTDVVIQNNNGGAVVEKIPYDFLVAGDGFQSSVRHDLVQKGLIRCTRYLRPVLWKALQLPSQPGLSPESFLPIRISNPSHKKGAAPEQFGALMPRHKDKFVLLTFWNRRRRGRFHQTNPFHACSPAEFKERLQEHLPQITRLPNDDFLARYLEEKPGRETYMKLSRHAVPSLKMALIGDAAVGMYSRMGQGCASALERAEILASAIATVDLKSNVPATSEVLENALQSFSSESARQGQAIADLNLLSHLEYNVWFSRFMVDSKILFPQLNTPELSYTDIAREYRWRILLGKFIWRFERLPMPSKN